MDTIRQGVMTRTTRETEITLTLGLDESTPVSISTGIPFFDHMLELFAVHGQFGLNLQARGDLSVDYHHTVEDVGIVLGEALKSALGDKAGIQRYGFFLLPMDECLCRFVMDLGGRSHLVWRVESAQTFVRDFNIILVREFFQAFANSAGANVHIALLYGDEPHHIAEAVFKAFGRALAECVRRDSRRGGAVPSSKGTLA
jgi:imidazoleglycerol-phosphate dehydratase